MFTYRQAKQ